MGTGPTRIQPRRGAPLPFQQQPDGVGEVRDVDGLHFPCAAAKPKGPWKRGKGGKQRRALPALADDERWPDHGPAGKAVLLGKPQAVLVRRCFRLMERRPRAFSGPERRDLDQLGHAAGGTSLKQRGGTRDMHLLEAVRAVPLEYACGVDNGVNSLKALAPIRGAVLREIAGEDFGKGKKTLEAARIAPACDDLMASALQFRRDPAADKTARPGNENAHRVSTL